MASFWGGMWESRNFVFDLTEVIDEKRKAKRNSNANINKKPSK